MSKIQNSKSFQDFGFVILKLFRVSSLEIRDSFSLSRKGFTTLELVMGLGLFVILSTGFLALANLYSSYSQLLPQSSLAAQVRRLHQLTIEDMKKETRQAESILANYTVDSTTYTTGTTTLVLRLRSIDTSNNIISGIFDHLIYSTNTSTPPIKLSKRVVSGAGSRRGSANLILNEAVRSIIFTYNTSTPSLATKVQLFLETSKTIGTVTGATSSTVEMTLR